MLEAAAHRAPDSSAAVGSSGTASCRRSGDDFDARPYQPDARDRARDRGQHPLGEQRAVRPPWLETPEDGRRPQPVGPDASVAAAMVPAGRSKPRDEFEARGGKAMGAAPRPQPAPYLADTKPGPPAPPQSAPAQRRLRVAHRRSRRRRCLRSLLDRGLVCTTPPLRRRRARRRAPRAPVGRLPQSIGTIVRKWLQALPAAAAVATAVSTPTLGSCLSSPAARRRPSRHRLQHLLLPLKHAASAAAQVAPAAPGPSRRRALDMIALQAAVARGTARLGAAAPANSRTYTLPPMPEEQPLSDLWTPAAYTPSSSVRAGGAFGVQMVRAGAARATASTAEPLCHDHAHTHPPLPSRRPRAAGLGRA